MTAHGLALYAAHHVGDYWVQTDHQALHKGKPGKEGALECAKHVATYTATQAAFLALSCAVTGKRPTLGRAVAALAVSAITHYAADRRDNGPMMKLARRLPSTRHLVNLGKPRVWKVTGARMDHEIVQWGETPSTVLVPLDNPTLGTGAWALDQSWHIALGVFVPALILEGRNGK